MLNGCNTNPTLTRILNLSRVVVSLLLALFSASEFWTLLSILNLVPQRETHVNLFYELKTNILTYRVKKGTKHHYSSIIKISLNIEELEIKSDHPSFKRRHSLKHSRVVEKTNTHSILNTYYMDKYYPRRFKTGWSLLTRDAFGRSSHINVIGLSIDITSANTFTLSLFR